MALFTNFLPTPQQTNVARTTLIKFSILTDGYNGAQINTLAATVNGVSVISSGNFVNGYSGQIFSATGRYIVGIYPKVPFLPTASLIPVHLQILDDYNSLDAYDYSFSTPGYQETETEEDLLVGVPDRICDRTRPFFPPTDLGLVAALDKGTGTEVELTWKQAYPFTESNIVFYNIYYSTQRINLFDGYPEFLVTDNSATIGGLPPGDTKYFGVRVAELLPSLFTTNGLEQAGVNMYYYPSTNMDGYVDVDDTIITVSNTNGFPNFGVLHIGGELIRYSSKTVNSFIVAERGFAGTEGEAHISGKLVRPYHGKEDGNTIIAQATPSFQKPNDALVWVKYNANCALDGYRDGYNLFDAYQENIDGYNALFDGYDGYYRLRQEPFDDITTNIDNNDASGDFRRFDYCGTYRRLSPQNFMQGQCTRSYWGGVQLVQNAGGTGEAGRIRVPDVRVHMLQREEALLESTGEPFVLLRRMWTGIRCSCSMFRREHSDARCGKCFSTGFVTGFQQFFNQRRPDRRILVRVDPTTDDVNLIDRGGLEPAYEPSCWTLPFPGIRDRDVLIRFNPDNTEEGRYEILNVDRVRAFFTQTGAQKFRIKKFPVTDIIFQFPVVRDTSPIPGSLTTSSNSGPGLVSHSHNLVTPDGVSLINLRLATLESQGHNHLVLNGVVQNILGHTHTV